jgi:hypothetical protein
MATPHACKHPRASPCNHLLTNRAAAPGFIGQVGVDDARPIHCGRDVQHTLGLIEIYLHFVDHWSIGNEPRFYIPFTIDLG